jgi:ribonuclease HI
LKFETYVKNLNSKNLIKIIKWLICLEEEQRVHTQVCWEAPPTGIVKCNWDAAIDAHGRRMGVGIVVRNHAGDVMATKCMTKAYVTDPQTAEAIAVWKAAELVQQLGIPHVILEGDALSVDQAMQREGHSWERFGHLLEAAKLLLGTCRSWTFAHVNRAANEAAHRMAKMGLDCNAEFLWQETVLLCIQHIVLREKHMI